MKRRKRKPSKAEREAEAAFDAMQKRWDKAPKFASGVYASPKTQPTVLTPALVPPPGRTTNKAFPSKDTGGNATKAVAPTTVYTGTAMLGVATMHKSNSVPVFSEQDAKDVSRMRR